MFHLNSYAQFSIFLSSFHSIKTDNFIPLPLTIKYAADDFEKGKEQIFVYVKNIVAKGDISHNEQFLLL